MKKLSNTEAELLIKKVCNSLINKLLHNLSFIIEIVIKYDFHSIVLNQPPVHSTSWKYSTSCKSYLKMDEI